jgi:hypothetical protein
MITQMQAQGEGEGFGFRPQSVGARADKLHRGLRPAGRTHLEGQSSVGFESMT